MEKFVTKGKEIAIEGKLTQELWWQNGEKRYVTEVVVTEVLLLGK
jgi:single-strand DNA-binding protein